MQKRKDSQGDYNAILGFITGFKVGSDGDIYKLDVTIKGMGNMPGMIQTTKPIISSDKGEGSNDEGEESTKKQPTPGLKYMDLGSHNQSLGSLKHHEISGLSGTDLFYNFVLGKE